MRDLQDAILKSAVSLVFKKVLCYVSVCGPSCTCQAGFLALEELAHRRWKVPEPAGEALSRC